MSDLKIGARLIARRTMCIFLLKKISNLRWQGYGYSEDPNHNYLILYKLEEKPMQDLDGISFFGFLYQTSGHELTAYALLTY